LKYHCFQFQTQLFSFDHFLIFQNLISFSQGEFQLKCYMNFQLLHFHHNHNPMTDFLIYFLFSFNFLFLYFLNLESLFQVFISPIDPYFCFFPIFSTESIFLFLLHPTVHLHQLFSNLTFHFIIADLQFKNLNYHLMLDYFILLHSLPISGKHHYLNQHYYLFHIACLYLELSLQI